MMVEVHLSQYSILYPLLYWTRLYEYSTCIGYTYTDQFTTGYPMLVSWILYLLLYCKVLLTSVRTYMKCMEMYVYFSS